MSPREFASWADPKATRKAKPSRWSNPFAGFTRDVVQVAKGWRWGSRPPVPRSLPPVARDAAARPGAPRRTLAEVVRGRRVTGLNLAGSQSRVVLAHVESAEDLAVLMETLPKEWRIVTSRVPQALARGRSLLLVTDFAAPESADVAAEAASLAARYGRDLLPVVVRRLRPAPADETPGPMGRGPKPRLVDEVQVRFADAVRDPHAATAARSARTAVAALLAEDDATWWQVLRGQVDSPLAEQMAPWRRVWNRTAPARSNGRQRKPIWR